MSGWPRPCSALRQKLWSLAKRASGGAAKAAVIFRAPWPADLRHDPYASLRIPNFRWFIISLLTMNVATQLQAVVVSWQVYALTRDPLSLGLIGLAEALPFIGFALPAGHLADRDPPAPHLARRPRRPARLLARAALVHGPARACCTPAGSGRSTWSSS